MKKIMMSLAACSMLLTTSCSNEEVLQQEKNQEYTLELNVGTESRTLFDEDGICIWGQNEKIYVTSQDGKVTGTLSLINTTEGGKKATFKGYVSGNPSNLKYAVYPVPTNNVISQTTLDGTNHNAPMTAAIGAGDNKTFDYAGGLVRLEVTGANTAEVTGDAVGFNYEFNLSTGKLEAIPGSGQTVSVSFNNGYAYIPVMATETPTSTTLEVKPAGVNTPIEIEANIKKSAVSQEEIAPIVVNGTTAETVKVVSTVDELNEAVENDGYIRLAKDIVLGTAVVISEEKTVTIDLNGFDVTAPTSDAFEVIGTLTLNGDDESIVYAGSDENNTASVCAVWANGGHAIINGGYYKVGHDKDGNSGDDNNRNDCIYAGYNEGSNGGTIEIHGGKFEYAGNMDVTEGNKFLLNCADSQPYTTSITVYGGSFKNNVPGCEAVTPAGRETNEVQLGGKAKVYNAEGTVVTDAHSGEADVWYEVK